jgi:hypothetical protein
MNPSCCIMDIGGSVARAGRVPAGQIKPPAESRRVHFEIIDSTRRPAGS